jgi:hypothetical protein
MSIFGLPVRPVEPLFFLKPRIVYGMYILYLSVAFVRSTDRATDVRGARTSQLNLSRVS